MQLVITVVFLLDIQLCLSYLELTLKRALISFTQKIIPIVPLFPGGRGLGRGGVPHVHLHPHQGAGEIG
jgi:hypothetical protein